MEINESRIGKSAGQEVEIAKVSESSQNGLECRGRRVVGER